MVSSKSNGRRLAPERGQMTLMQQSVGWAPDDSELARYISSALKRSNLIRPINSESAQTHIQIRLLGSASRNGASNGVGGRDAKKIFIFYYEDFSSLTQAIDAGAHAYVCVGNDYGCDAGLRRIAHELERHVEKLTDNRDPIFEQIKELARAGELRRKLFERDNADNTPPVCRLNDNQINILTAIADGLKDREVGRKLDYGTQTIKNQMTTIRQIVRAKTRSHAVAIAIRAGWIE